jgi:hypothetical protein
MVYHKSDQFKRDSEVFIKKCCPYLKTTYNELLFGKHTKDMRTAREYMLHVLIELYGTSLTDYAHMLNRKSHFTIKNINTKFDNYYACYEDYRNGFRLFFDSILSLYETERTELRERILKYELGHIDKQHMTRWWVNKREDIVNIYS